MFCSGVFLLLGIINFLYFVNQRSTQRHVMIMILFGVFFSFLGDLTINLMFEAGAAIFALGHIFFVISYFLYERLHRIDLIIFLVLSTFSICFVLFFPPIYFENEIYKYICLIYSVIISLMVSKSIGNCIVRGNDYCYIISLSSILFFISDLMLLLAWFSSITGWTNHACMALYYPAMCLFSFSIIIYTKQYNKAYYY